ncbi:alcohol dehydrogenase catalytic domain-containing protein [uncultured Cohaesibacter sp.]|uniref:zinc-dependent alcohol dehydrogenase n=1 Tax=uncultured Cohaesibacter sp. TaxID=1002546 RepID=UPI00292FA259|nr:alcohol dehydrogenase catalytic domain-containing protein [uncultured Cohaesibacter sp.]
MKAVRLHAKQDLRVEDVALPLPPKVDEVTLAVTYAGICGSDLHNFRTGEWITRAPSVAGHELTGIIEAIGDDVSHVAVGDKVIVDSRHICGVCRNCQDGLGQVCEKLGFIGEVIDGGFAEAVTLPARNVLKAPDGVPDRHLALAEPIAVALHTLNRLAAPCNAEIVVAGCGPIGGLVALLASQSGHKVAVIDRNEARAKLVCEMTGGRILDLESDWGERAPRHGVDATGSPFVIGRLVDKIAPGGAIALVGIGHGTLEVNPIQLVEKETALIGCHAFGGELETLVDLLPRLTDKLDAVIAEEITLDAVPDAYQRHLDGKVDGLKTIMRCQQG